MFFCFYNMSLLFVPFTIFLSFFPSQSEHPWTTWTGSDGATPDRKNHVKPWNELRAHGGASPLRAMQTVQVPSKRKKNNTGKQNNRQNRQRKKNTERKGEKSNCNTARWKLAHQRWIPTAKKKVEKSARTVANAHPTYSQCPVSTTPYANSLISQS